MILIVLQDFIDCSTDEELRQDFMIAVSQNRHKVPMRARKKDLAALKFT